MKYFCSILVNQLLFVVVSGANDYNFFPNLPAVSEICSVYYKWIIRNINTNKYIIFHTIKIFKNKYILVLRCCLFNIHNIIQVR